MPLKVWQISQKFSGNGHTWGFWPWQVRRNSAGDCLNDRQPEMAIYMFWATILPFQAVCRCRSHFATLFWSSSLSKILNFPIGFQCCLSFRDIYFWFQRPFPVVGHYWNHTEIWAKNITLSSPWRYKYFRFGCPHCCFRLSIVFEVTVFEIAVVNSVRLAVEKKQIWHFFK